MIENGTITYSNKDPWLLSWSIDNESLNSVFIALLSTTAALQGAAIVFDLVLGFKRRGTLKLHDLHMYLLSTGLSALAVVDATFRNDWISKKRLRGDVPKNTGIGRDSRKIRWTVYFRLFLLLFIGPVLSVVVISLSLEANWTYTFSEAGFGGLSFGIDPDSQAHTGTDSENCFSNNVSYGKTDSALVSFHTCRFLDLDNRPQENVNLGEVLLVVSVTDRGFFNMIIANETSIVSLRKQGEMRRLGQTSRVKPEVNDTYLLSLAEFGSSKLEKACGSSFASDGMGNSSTQLYARYRGACNNISYITKVDVVFAMSHLLTFKNAKEFMVVNFLDIPFADDSIPTPYVSANDMPFILRTRGHLSLILLVIITMIIVVLRVFIRLCLAYNDFLIATEIIIKDRFSAPACDSMLQNDTVVEFRKKFQLVGRAHFGISSGDGFPEVEYYEGGRVG